MASETSTFDPTPLTAPVDRADVRAFTAELRRSGALTGRIVQIVVMSIIGGVILVFAVPTLVALVWTVGSGATTISPVSIAFIAFFIAVVALITVAIVRSMRGAAEKRYRLDRFARANGLSWRGEVDDPELPGMIFDQGHDREAKDVISGHRPRFIEVANYSYKTGSGKNESTHDWGYVAIRLDTPLPHIVLDAESNNGLFGGSSLPVSFTRRQRLSLEGDFDKHFSLYCPEGYERDALYLFTPDVMARFIDNAAALDVEIVDDWLFLYARRDLTTLDPAMWEWLFTTIAAIEDKVDQWARWRDERLTAPASISPGAATPLLTPPPAGVATAGRRLKRGFSWVTVAIFVAVGSWWLLTTLADVFSN